MNKYKKLLNNSLIFTIGSFGSKLISFLMVPLYTNLLTTEQYGTIDLITITISWLLPILTLEIGQASIRYVFDAKNESEKKRINDILLAHIVLVTVFIILIMSILILIKINLFKDIFIYFFILLILTIFNNIYSQFIRGLGHVKEFAINGILMTTITVLSNVILLVIFDFKIEGYIISLILANLFSNLYLMNVIGYRKIYRNFSIDYKLYKTMIRFTLPIIPNSIIWWIINGSVRYFVLFFHGSAVNGLYAVASKIPSVVSLLTGIFAQAWQLSSFEEFNSKDRDIYYSKVFNLFSCFLFVCGSGLLVVLKPIFSFFIDNNYYIGWQAVPGLIIAVIYQSFASFLGTNYTAAKETSGTFKTSLLAGIVSLVSSILLIPRYGLVGASLSSTISFIIMFISRLMDTKKYVSIKISTKEMILVNSLLFIQIIVLFFLDNLPLFITQFLLFTMVIWIYKDNFNNIFKKIRVKKY